MLCRAERSGIGDPGSGSRSATAGELGPADPESRIRSMPSCSYRPTKVLTPRSTRCTSSAIFGWATEQKASRT